MYQIMYRVASRLCSYKAPARSGADNNCDLVRMHEFHADSAHSAPLEPASIGERIRKRRRELRLTQRQTGNILGSTESTVNNLERMRTQPEACFVPTIVEFLGTDPLPEPGTFAERLIHSRRLLGLSRAECSWRTGIDESCLAGWERGRTKPLPRSVARLQKFFGWDDRAA